MFYLEGGVGMNMSKTKIDMEKTGMWLKTLARFNGYSVKEIQEYLGLSCPQPVYRWFKGLILPSVDNLLRLSELFHMHMEELLITDSVVILDAAEVILSSNNNFKKRIYAYVFRLAA